MSTHALTGAMASELSASLPWCSEGEEGSSAGSPARTCKVLSSTFTNAVLSRLHQRGSKGYEADVGLTGAGLSHHPGHHVSGRMGL